MQTPMAQQEATERRQIVVNANYEMFVFALTILLLVNTLLWVLMDSRQELQVILVISAGISIFLMMDAAFRLLRPSRRPGHLFQFHGGLLVLGSLPIPFFILFRLLWDGLMFRKIRRADYHAIGELVVERRAQSTLLFVILAAIIVLEVAATLIMGAESQSPQANIQDANDALWWTIVTMATVGYGDKYPVTLSGRVIAVFVMIVGVGLFSVLTSFMAQWFFRSRQPVDVEPEVVSTRSEDYQAVIARLDTLTILLEQQGATQRADASELRARLAEIEERLARGR